MPPCQATLPCALAGEVNSPASSTKTLTPLSTKVQHHDGFPSSGIQTAHVNVFKGLMGPAGVQEDLLSRSMMGNADDPGRVVRSQAS